MATCALFIDYENVHRSLRGQGIHVTHKELAELFRTTAHRYGELIHARAYAPWDLFPEAMPAFDRQDIKPEYVEGGRKDNADMVMSLSIQDWLRVPGREADTFILVTGDGDFVHVIRLLQAEGRRVVVWGVEGSISSRLTSRVAEVVSIQDLLQGAASPGPTPAPAAGPFTDQTRALVLRTEAAMVARGWVQIPFLTLLNELGKQPLFAKRSVDERRQLIVHCLDEEILETKKQPNPKRPGTETTFVLLKKDHPLVAQTLRWVSEVVTQCRRLGGGRPVAAQALEQALASEPTLSQGAGAVGLELCLAEGLLARPAADSYQLDEKHPLVRLLVPPEELSPMLTRLILAMDHYLSRTGYQWMSMGLLRQQLMIYGQREMERSIRSATDLGVVVIRQQPNRFGSRPTTGTYLCYDHPATVQVLAMRDRLLDGLCDLYAGRELLTLNQLTRYLEESGLLRGEAISAGEWLQLLLQHQLLGRGEGAGGREGIRLQKGHPTVARRLGKVI